MTGEHVVHGQPVDAAAVRWKAIGDYMHAMVRDYARSGILDHAQAAELSYRIATKVIDKAFGESGE